MSGGPEVRQQLAEVLWDFDAATGAGIPDDELADALLPVVERISAERAAEALEAAAWDVEAGRPHIPPSTDPNRHTAVIVRSTLNRAARVVRARAEAMVTGRQEGPSVNGDAINHDKGAI